MPEPLCPGRIIELKSGGPKMTLVAVDGTDALCQWFAGDVLKERRFPLATIRPLDIAELSTAQLEDIVRNGLSNQVEP